MTTAAEVRPEAGGRRWSYDATAAAVFGVALAVAVPVLRWTNREQWFFLDEWDFLASRSLSDPGDLLRSHNGHWVAIPIVVYRVLFSVVGLHHYWPYQAVTIGVHLALAVLVRAVMRRAGADAWISTAAAVLLLYFGSGRSNIGWAFQMGFAGSVALGLGQLLLADHPGRSPRRDSLAVVLGLAAITTCGPGVAMVAGTGAAVWWRRGWRAAAVQVLPLAVVFSIWYSLLGSTGATGGGDLGGAVRFVVEMFAEAFQAMAQSGPAAVVLLAASAAGLFALVRSRRGARLGDEPASICLAPAVSAVAFALLTAWGRAGTAFTDGPGASRYMHLMAALLLPVVAVGLTGLVRNRSIPWRWAAVVVVLAGLPGNVDRLEPSGTERFTLGRPSHWSTIAHVASDGRVPADHRPEPFEAPEVTVGWLDAAVDDGRVPAVEPRPVDLANAEAALSLRLVDPASTPGCRTAETGNPLRLDEERVAVLAGASRMAVTVLVDGAPAGSVLYATFDGTDLAVSSVAGTVEVVVTAPGSADGDLRVCDLPDQ